MGGVVEVAQDVVEVAQDLVSGIGGSGGSGGSVTKAVTKAVKSVSRDSEENAPSYSIDTEAAKRRKRALALQRGLMSTTKNNNIQNDVVDVFSPSLQGKQKLGQ